MVEAKGHTEASHAIVQKWAVALPEEQRQALEALGCTPTDHTGFQRTLKLELSDGSTWPK